jgi:DNA repair exonuclease SbcCD ATPase subunit
MIGWGRKDRKQRPPRRSRPGAAGFWLGLILLLSAAGAAAFYHFGQEIIRLDSREIIERQAQEITELQQKIADPAEEEQQTALLLEEIELLQQERQQLQQELSDLRNAAIQDDSTETAELRQMRLEISEKQTEIEQLQASLQLAEQVHKEQQQELELAESEVKILQSRLDKAFNTEIPALNARLAERDEALEQIDQQLARMTRLEDELKAARNALGRQNNSRSIDNSASRVIELEQALDAARSEIASLNRQLQQSKSDPDDIELGNGSERANESDIADELPEQRDPLQVASALQQAAGLGNLSEERRDRIATRLIEGDCVSDVLRDEFGRAPALALRDLLSALNSDC